MRRALLFSLVLLSAGAAAQIPVLQVSPLSLAFILDGRNPAAPQQVRIRNLGSGTLHWTARPAEPWIRVSPQTGTGPALLTVEIDRTRLAAGRYEGRIVIDAGSADDSPVSVAVSVEAALVPAAGPPPAAQPAPGPVREAGPGPLRIARQILPPATRNLPYAQAIPIAGGTPPYAVRIVEGRLPAGLVLAQGSVAGTARVQGYYPFVVAVTDGSTPPVTIAQPLGIRVIILQPDTALVVSPPAIGVRLASRTRDGRAALAVASGRQTLEWTAGADVPWLRLSPASGVTPATIEVVALAGRLTPGTHLGTVTVTMEGAPNSPASIPVQVTVPR
ncbi:MAG: putative Ig domain-containing protein [Vicinamibacterales bacterium]